MVYDKNKAIVELDKMGGKIIMYWPSAKAASVHYGINQVNICYNVKGRCKQAKGHFFRFATNEEIEQYKQLQDRLDCRDDIVENTEEQPIILPHIPIEVIPETIEKDEVPLSEFERMLQNSKKKFDENSD